MARMSGGGAIVQSLINHGVDTVFGLPGVQIYGFFVEEVCQVGFASWIGFPVYKPRTYVTCGYQGTLGFGFPTALGVKVANPDKAVISVAGDGWFMFAVQELATAVKYNIGVVTVLFNNHAFGNVRRDQEERYHGRVVASDLVNPDFMKLAESFGVQGYLAQGADALKKVMEQALGKNAPCLIEVPVEKGSEPSPWNLIYPRGVNPLITQDHESGKSSSSSNASPDSGHTSRNRSSPGHSRA